MTREEARKAAEVMLAYADGKQIEVLCDDGEWGIEDDPEFYFIRQYRVKKEPSFGPFVDAKEAMKEMLKHQPFGLLKCENDYILIIGLSDDRVETVDGSYTYQEILDDYTFADGAKFGIKED